MQLQNGTRGIGQENTFVAKKIDQSEDKANEK
jgi:hypothetical protein